MRRMILELSPELLAQMLTTGTGMVQVVANPLPADARIVDARLSFGGINLQLVIESETFREVEPGNHLGYLPAPVFRRKPECSRAEFYMKMLERSRMTPAEIARLENQHSTEDK